MSAPSSPLPVGRPSPSRHSVRSTSETISLSSSITSDRPISPDPPAALGEKRPRMLTRPSSSVFLGGGGGSTGPGSGAAGDGTMRLPGFTTAVGLGSPGLFRNPRKSSADFGNTVSEDAAETDSQGDREEEQRPSGDDHGGHFTAEDTPLQESKAETIVPQEAFPPRAASPKGRSPRENVIADEPSVASSSAPKLEEVAQDRPSSSAASPPRSPATVPRLAAQEVSTPERPSRRTGDKLSAEAPSAEDQDVTPKRTVFRRDNDDDDDDLDALIRDAEEKIKLASTGRRRAGPASVRQMESIEGLNGRASPAPSRTGLRRYESIHGLDERTRSNTEAEEAEFTGEPTLKRSATVSAALGGRAGQAQRRVVAERDERLRDASDDRFNDWNGNTSSAPSRRRPLPTDFVSEINSHHDEG